MAAKKKGGGFVGNPRNETDTMNDTPDSPDSELYASYGQVMKGHLSQDGASMVGTANSESGAGIMGGPAPGEPNPVGTKTKA